MIRASGYGGHPKGFVRGHRPDDVTLHTLHVLEGFPSPAIARKYDVKRQTARAWLIRAGIEVRNRFPNERLTRAKHQFPGSTELQRLYCEEKRSTGQIGEQFGVKGQTVSSWLRRCDIPIRSTSEAKKLAYAEIRPTPDELERMYVLEEMSGAEISRTLGVDVGTGLEWLRDAGIRIRTLSETQTIRAAKRPKKVARTRDVPPRMRYLVLARDSFRCCACGRSPRIHGVVLHVDHVHPWAKGGKAGTDNLQSLCADCNHGKSDLIL